MRYQPIVRDAHSYQCAPTAAQVEAMCRRVLGPGARPEAVVENAFGSYNSTFRIELSEGAPVYLRVAPEPRLQLRSERQFMRNEHAAVPFLAPVAPLLPRTLGIDFTHEIIDRDYMIQSQLEGTPAPEGLTRYPRSQWGPLFRDLGSIARRIHGVRGDHFGFVAGPAFSTWSEALLASLDDVVADHDHVGLASADVRQLTDLVSRHRALLDEVAEPRLLHGDLWTVNVTIADEANEPRIVGVCDWDRTSWGDPLADWTIFVARKQDAVERDTFWDTYGRDDRIPREPVRAHLYEARHLVMARLERYRLGHAEQVEASYREVASVLEQIPA